jgi:type II secretion system protein C
MHRFASRHFGLIRFLAICVVVSFAGSALSTHVASKLLLDTSLITSAAETEPESDEPEEEDVDERAAAINARALESMADKSTYKQRTAEAIVGQNVFCPTCVVTDAEPVLADASGLPMSAEPVSTLPLQLLATMESDDPAWSMATILDLESHMLGPYTANEQLRPGVTILAVERGRVVILNQGRREHIPLGAAPPPAPVAKPAPSPQSAKSKPGNSVAIEGAEQAINCSSEHACTVDRKFVEQLMQSPQQLMSQARMFPVTKDGETAGFRVSGVRKGSLATLLGLENGDVVSEVNGNKLGSIDDALAMVQKLRRASHLSVVVERGGAVITKEISIK